jgi:putative membrane protein
LIFTLSSESAAAFQQGGIVKFLLRLLVLAVTVFLISYLFPGLIEVDNFVTALIVALVLAIINAFVRPVVLILTLPLNLLTLGLFTFVINAFMLIMTSAIVPGFRVHSFWTALLSSVLISIVNAFISSGLSEEEEAN